MILEISMLRMRENDLYAVSTIGAKCIYYLQQKIVFIKLYLQNFIQRNYTSLVLYKIRLNKAILFFDVFAIAFQKFIIDLTILMRI